MKSHKTSDAYPLGKRLPAEGEDIDAGALLDRFLSYVEEKGVTLYPAQEEAILSLYEGANVILKTPTGSGKSLVATALHFYAVARGRRSYYTCPIKALVNEKFLALCQEFGPDLVGMSTGDATVNKDALIICCTAEILSNIALREGEAAPVEDVIMDEFHYYSDRQRGVAWQIPLLTLPYARFLLMSATLGDTSFFEKGLSELTAKETKVISSADRPVPLDFVYQETPLHQTIRDLVFGGKSPVYLVNFTQRECAEAAQDLLSIDVCSKDEKKAIATALEGFKFSSPYGKEIQKVLRHGIGLHHAGLLPKYRLLVERLAQQGLLKVICGTDTLGVGVNVPIRTVLFTKLCKFDGEKTGLLSVRDFLQISGRAGRKGFDDQGTVVAQAPEHVIENKMMEAKAGGDLKKAKKFVKRKPPEKGYVPWDESTFKRLMTAPPEALQSRFQVTHSMLLNVLNRPGDGCKVMKQLVRSSHETPHAKRTHRKIGFQLFRSLLERNIISFRRDASGKPIKSIQVNVDLQDEFSLNQTLSLYLLDTIKLLDTASDTYALDLLSLVEAILENPDTILYKQVDRLKSKKMAELKAQGMEYEDRIAELEKIEHPKPNRDFIYDTFNKFAATHPWVGQENIRPKAIVLEMFETFQSFDEYIRSYDLHRSEGLLLRYISEVYKALSQTVPELARNEEVISMIDYLRTMIRNIDSSLLDEWERMRSGVLPTRTEKEQTGESLTPQNITQNAKSFTVLVRNEVFRIVRAMAERDGSTICEAFGWSELPSELVEALKQYFTEHEMMLTDRQARHPQYMRVDKEWNVEQTILDAEGLNDWSLKLAVDLPASIEANRAVLKFTGLSAI